MVENEAKKYKSSPPKKNVADFCISLMKGVEEMAGRPRKIIDISTGKIGKQEKLNRKVQEEKLKLGREDIENFLPEWLNEDAAKEFKRVVTEAKKNRFI